MSQDSTFTSPRLHVGLWPLTRMSMRQTPVSYSYPERQLLQGEGTGQAWGKAGCIHSDFF